MWELCALITSLTLRFLHHRNIVFACLSNKITEDPVAVIHWEASYLTALQMSAFTRTVEVVEIVNSGLTSDFIAGHIMVIPVAGIVLNALLLIAIGRFSPNYLGTYKYLLTIFAFLDGYLAIIHVIVHPVSKLDSSCIVHSFWIYLS